MFANELVQVDFNNTAQFGSRATATIPKNGDLLSEVYLAVKLPRIASTIVNATAITETNFWGYVNKIGYAMIQDVTLEIGGQVYDKHTSEYLDIMDELAGKSAKKPHEIIGDFEGLHPNFSALDATDGVKTAIWKKAFEFSSSTAIASTGKPDPYLYIPLKFWFNQTVSMALPMVALSFHDVKLTFNFRALSALTKYWGKETTNAATLGTLPSSTIPEAYLLCNYVYLDAPERVTFGSGSEIEYLIDTLQTDTLDLAAAATSATFNITFNHPIKELLFVIRGKRSETGNDWFNYNPTGTITASNTAGGLVDPALAFKNCRLRFNGHDRFSKQPTTFFKTLMPSKVHTNVPSKNIFVYSFALDPESEKPTGTANFSRIDQITLNFEFNGSEVHDGNGVWGPSGASILLFGRNYNVIKIVNGMAGIKYAS